MNPNESTPEDRAAAAGILRFGARLAADPQLRRRIEADPRAALAEMGAPVPDNVEFRVVSNTDDTMWFAFPPDPNADLSDSMLEPVSGGRASTASTVGSNSTASSFPSCVSSVGSASTLGSAASRD